VRSTAFAMFSETSYSLRLLRMLHCLTESGKSKSYVTSYNNSQTLDADTDKIAVEM